MRRQVKQRIDLEHAHALVSQSDLFDLVTGLDVAFLDHAEIESGAAVPDQQRSHVRLVHANAEPVAGDARLRHFEQGRADPVAVSDAHVGVGEALDRKVLAELAVNEVRSTEMLLPVPIGFVLIDEYGTMFAAMSGRIALAVAVDIEPAHPARACDRRLPDAGVDGPTLPGDVARQADIDRK